jgi:ETFB lysine methyltransferase
VATQLNARLNCVEIETNSINLLKTSGRELHDFDVILVGDLFYDEEISVALMSWLRRLKSTPKVLIGDPGRHAFSQDKTGKLKLLATYQLPENCCIENNGFSHAFVWQF